MRLVLRGQKMKKKIEKDEDLEPKFEKKWLSKLPQKSRQNSKSQV